MPRGFLVKREASTHHGAWSDDDVITSPLPVSSHESPDSGYCAHSPLSNRDDVTSGPPPPPSLMTSSAAVLRTATSIYQQLMLRRHAETIIAAAAKTANASLFPLGNSSLLGTTGNSSTAGLYPVLAPYLMPGAQGSGAVALNLSNRTDDLKPSTAHDHVTCEC